jgi:drug/metabolite transporter (DMT)-like permease
MTGKPKTNKNLTSYLILAVSVVALSFAGPLVKKAGEAQPFALGFLRLTIASILIMPIGRPWEIKNPGKSVYWAMLSGIFLFGHFTGWFYALKYGSVAVATTMLAMLPVVVMLYEFFFYRKKSKLRQLLGICIAVVGTAVIVFNNMNNSGQLLCVIIMIFSLASGGFYLMFSMKAQETLNTWQTVSIMYTTTWACFGAMVLLTGQPIAGLQTSTYLWIASVAIVPQFLGHTLLNFSCKNLSPVVATTATLAQPFIAAFVSWLWFGQTVTWLTALGALIVVGGIFVTLRTSPPEAMATKAEIEVVE